MRRVRVARGAERRVPASLAEAEALARAVGARRTRLVGMSCDLGPHEIVNSELLARHGRGFPPGPPLARAPESVCRGGGSQRSPVAAAEARGAGRAGRTCSSRTTAS